MAQLVFNRLMISELIETIDGLKRRIEKRLPGRNLAVIAEDVRRVASDAARRSRWARQPNIALRVLNGVLIIVMVSILIYALGYLHFTEAGAWEMIEGVDAAISSIVFLGVTTLTVVTFENRVKRRKLLDAIHELRVLAHIIDMHQLAKDPDMFLHGQDERAEPAETPEDKSGRDPLTPFLVGRYLDYCSELLSLIGKVAVIYVQDFQDPVVLTAVDEIEHLTTSLSRKIWQKIMIIDQIISADA